MSAIPYKFSRQANMLSEAHKGLVLSDLICDVLTTTTDEIKLSDFLENEQF